MTLLGIGYRWCTLPKGALVVVVGETFASSTPGKWLLGYDYFIFEGKPIGQRGWIADTVDLDGDGDKESTGYDSALLPPFTIGAGTSSNPETEAQARIGGILKLCLPGSYKVFLLHFLHGFLCT